jgi:methyl-accepting chemotaxis protein
MKSLTIGTKFRAGSLILFAVTLIMGLSSVLALRSMNQSFETAVQKTARKLQLGGSIDTIKSDMYVAQRGMVLATFMKDRDKAGAQKREFEAQAAKMKATLDETAPLVSVPEGKRLFPIMNTDLDSWLVNYQEVVRLCENGNPAKAQQLSFDKIAPIYRDFGETASRFIAVYQDVLSSDVNAATAEYSRNVWIATTLLGLSALVGIALLLVTRQVNNQLRRMVSELSSGADQVAAASGQIATTSQSLSQGSTEQASSVEEISASMEKMASLATTVIGETAAQVGHSNAALAEMVGSMNSIKASSERVAKINKTIDEIAFQTNILALNAAVEAARAGEAGKGFAVVADEVRNLAQRAAAAAKDTAALIEESIVNSNQGVLKVELVSAAIREITDSSGKIKELVGQGNDGSGKQAQGSIQQVSTAIQQVNIVTQSNAANAEESAAAAEELNAQSMTVRELVNKLRHMVDGGQENGTRAVHFNGARGGRPPSAPVIRKPARPHADESFPMESVESGSFRNF